MSIHRFFVPDLSIASELRLDESESRHAMRALRCEIGDQVKAFDGRGGEALCQVTKLAKNAVELEILERLDSNCELPMHLTMLVSLPKGDRQKTLVEMLTQLGVSRIVPLVTQRGVAQPVPSAVERLRRTVIEASKQCGRNRLMEIVEPLTVGSLTAESAILPASSWRLVAHPDDEKQRFKSSVFSLPPILVSTLVAVGPEGGFTDEEIAKLVSSGWSRVTLGRRILRVETAAVAMAASIVQWMEDLANRETGDDSAV